MKGDAHIRGGGKAPYEVPRELGVDEIPRVVEDFVKAAKNAKAAGFDGVEIHGANGYLIDEFLQSTSNRRTDKYGGTFPNYYGSGNFISGRLTFTGSKENRFRFAREVIEAVKTVYPAEQIGIRFSPNGAYGDMGSEDNFDTFSYAISEVDKLGLGYVHVMDGLGFGFHGKDKVFRLYDARRLFSRVIIGNVGYTKEKAEGVIEGGVADLVAFGRPFISNPDLVDRFKNNLPLADPAPYDAWYYMGKGEESRGYTDYPTYAQQKEAAV